MPITEVPSNLIRTSPYAKIGIVFVTWPNGTQSSGTCAVVGVNDILTAGHVVYNPDRGGWASDFKFYFGADYNNLTNRFDSNNFSYSLTSGFRWNANAWPDELFADFDNTTLRSSESQYDIALIGVSVALGDIVGWFGLDSGRDYTQTVEQVGYPANSTGMMSSSITVTKNSLYDIYESPQDMMGPGSSGGPLFTSDGYIIGVKSSGDVTSATWADFGFLSSYLIQYRTDNNYLIGTVTDDYSASISTTGRAVLGSSVSGVIETIGDKDWFAVTLTAGTLYKFSLSSQSGGLGDPMLKLYGLIGLILLSDDDSGAGLDSEITYTPLASGTFYLEALYSTSSYAQGSSTGGYKLSVATILPTYAVSTSAASVNEGSTVQFSIVTTNVAAGTAIYYSITGVSASDLQAGVLTGAVSASSTGTTTISIPITADGITEGLETLTVTVQGKSASTIINDTSQASPTITVDSNRTSLVSGQTAIISFTLSKSSTNFVAADITVTGGTLSSFSGSGTTYTALFTPAANSLSAGVVSVASGTFSDTAGNVNADGTDANNTVKMTVNTMSSVPIIGTTGADTLMGTSGNDNINGFSGIDTVSYSSLSAAYTLSSFDPTNGLNVSGPDGNDVLLNIERVEFKDAVLAFDTDGTAGQVFRLYQAAFKRIPDMNGLGDWITARDTGMTSEQVATAFMESAEFKSLYGASSTDSQFITLLYSNALLRGASDGEIAYWVTQLKGPQTRAQVLVSFSESAENKAALQPSISTGILYTNSQQKLVGVFGTTFSGTSGNDNLIGTVRSDIFLGGAGDDVVYGGYGKDFVTGGPGNDLIYGGPGIDTAIYAGTRLGHAITATSNSDSNVKDLKITNTSNGTDTLIGVERIKFDDITLAFDTSGNAGQTYRLYQAAFKRTPDKAGLSGWINAIDNGMSLASVANSFIQSAEFKSLYGANPTDSQLVTLLYTNALNRTADTAGLNYWVGQLSNGAQTRAQALIGFSESTENQAALIGIIQNGIEITA